MITQKIKLIPRLLIAPIFIIPAIGKILTFEATKGYMSSHGIPVVEVLLPITIFLLLAAGILLIINYQLKKVVLGLIMFMIPTTLIFHSDFNDYQQLIHFLKNLAIIGALILLVQVNHLNK